MTASAWNWILAIVGSVASIAGVVFSWMAWVQASGAKKAAEEEADAVRTRETANEFLRLAADANGLVASVQARDRERAIGATDMSGATAFSTTLEGNLKAEVSLTKSGREELLAFSLVEFDPSPRNQLAGMMGIDKPFTPDKNLLSVSVEKDPSFGFDSPSERELSKALVDLYGVARRSALKIEGSVQKALTYLDKLAV